MASDQLEKRTWNYAMKLKNLKHDHGAVVGAEYYEIKRVDHSVSRRIHIVKKLRKRLELLGKINTESHGNIIGGCAEVGAANKVLRMSKKIKIDDLQFSRARRPRSMQVVPICNNCLITFYNGI